HPLPEHVRPDRRAARRQPRRQHGAADGSLMVGRQGAATKTRKHEGKDGLRAFAPSWLICASLSVLVAWMPVTLLRAARRAPRLIDAGNRRDDKAFTALLRPKADINAAAPDGATALAWAAHLGERRMADALLDAGAAANTADEYGESPVTLAAANGDAALVARLLKAGADAGVARRNGQARAVDRAGGG